MKKQHHNQVLCQCGGWKLRTARVCRTCYRAELAQLSYTPSRGGSYWTKGRYSLLVVWGYSAVDVKILGATLSVLDSHDCWREVRRDTARVQSFEGKRADVVAWIERENQRERKLAAVA